MTLSDHKQKSEQEAFLLKVRKLRKFFLLKKRTLLKSGGSVQALCDINFEVSNGETLALVGESGSGKTTIARIIMRLIEPDEGDVFFEGKSILDVKGKSLFELRQKIQMIFQDPYSSLNPHKTVAQIIAEPLRIHKICRRKDVRDRIVELLESVGLTSGHLKHYPHEFSGGQRQRIGIARALTVKPNLIVCDEPVSALDVSVRAQILNLLAELQENFKLTYIFIGHDLSVVRHVSNRVAVIYLGKIVEIAPTTRFYAHPLHPYSEALISATPVADPQSQVERIVLSGDIPSSIAPPPGCRFHTRCFIAEKICSQEEPPLTESSSGHFVSCFKRS